MLDRKYTADLLDKAKHIKLLICDVDGVLSNGKVYYTNNGEEIKSFNIKDGLGIKKAQENGIDVAIITGRQSEIVSKRSQELGISHIYQGNVDKRKTYVSLLNKLGLKNHEAAHVGDDLPDLPLMTQSGLGIAVADAHNFVKDNADWITQTIGGNGAVREVTDLLLFAQGKLDAIQQNYLNFD